MKFFTSILYKAIAAFMTVVMALAVMPISPVYANVEVLNEWTGVAIINTTSASPQAGTYTVPAGIYRLLTVAVTIEYSNIQAQNVTATYGGQALTMITQSTNQRQTVWVGYLKEAGIVAAGANTTLNVVYNSTNLTRVVVHAATYGGVDQANPVAGSNSNSVVTGTSITYGVNVPVVNAGYIFYVTNRDAASVTTPPAGYTEHFSANFGVLPDFNKSVASKAVTLTGTENQTIAFTGGNGRSAISAVSLNPSITPTITLSSSSNPSTYGTAITFTAVINQLGATGTVNFYNGATLLGSGTLSTVLGVRQATFTTGATQLSAIGSPYSITATYVGDGSYNAATSPVLTQTVLPKAASVTPNPASKTYGSADPSFSGTLSGFIASDGVTVIYTRAAGETVLGSPYTISATLSPSGVLGNYSITYNTANFNITKKAASVVPNDASKAYGSADPIFAGTLSGFLVADGVSAAYTRTVGETVLGSPYIISAVLSPSGVLNNYDISYNTANFDITVASLNITALSDTVVYGDAALAITPIYTGLQNTDLAPAVPPICSTTATNTSPVGSYPSTCLGAVDSNYIITYTSGAIDVVPASLNIAASSDTMVYGGTVPTIIPIYTGLKAGNTAPVTPPTCSTTATNTSSVGSYPSNCINALDANYNITYTAGTVDITAAVLTVTANNDSKVYDHNPYSGGNGVVYSGFIPGDTAASALSGVPAYFGSSQGAVNQGSYVITPGGLTANNGNYTFNYVGGTLAITPASLTVTATNDSKTYDGVAYSGGNGVTYSGFAVGDNAGNSLGGTLTYSGSSQGAVNQGTYVITPSGLTADNGNYTITYVDGTLTIGLRLLTITANDDTKPYDGNAYGGGNGVSYNGFAPGDNTGNALGGVLIYSGSSQGAVNQGTYAITLGGLTAANYTIVYDDGVLNITSIVLTVTSVNDAKAYDGIAYTGGNGVTYGGFAVGDNAGNSLGGTLTYSGTSQGAINQGSYAITPGGLTANNGNYTFSYQSGVLSITSITLTISASNDVKVYDSAPYSGGNGVSYNGFVPGDNAGNSLGGTLTYSGTSQGAVNQGNYVITPGGLISNNGNYTIVYANGELTIGQRAITVKSVTDTKVYDGNTFSIGVPTITSGTLAGPDTATLTQTFDTKNVGTNKALIPQAVISDGNGGSNYIVTYINDNTGVISGITLTVNGITASNKIYDGNTVASINTALAMLVGVTPGDDVQLDVTGITGTFVNKNVGNGKTVAISGLVLTGADSDNYGLTMPATTANITTRAITVTAQTDTKPYDGSTSSSVVPSITIGLLSNGDTANFTQSFSTPTVGTSKLLTPSGAMNDGNGGGNYLITFVNDTTGVINALPITITADAKAKAFGNPDPALTYTITNGALVGGGDSLSGSLTRVAGETVGSYAILQGSLSAGPNYNITYIGANLTISIVNQTITVVTPAPATAAYNSNFNVTATASSGLPVAITTTGAACTGSGSTTATIVMISGTGICTIHFNQAGNINFGPALEVLETTTAQRADQTISVNTSAPANATFNTGFNVAATATSGLPVTYNAVGVCTNVGSNFTVTSGTGICTVQYNQAGNANYNAALQVTQTANAQKANQNINITTSAPANAVFDSTFAVSANASSGLAVTYTAAGSCSNVGATFTMTLPTGICTVQYNQAGNADYNAAPQMTQTTNAQKANQTITVTTSAPASASFGTTFTVAGTASSGLPVAYTSAGSCTNAGATFTVVSASGSCIIQYNQAGDANYNAAPQVAEFTNSLLTNQTINVMTPAPANAPLGSSFTVAATASSGLPVAYSAVGSCTNVGADFTMTSSSGTCTVQFNQDGNVNFNPAPQVTNTTNAQKVNQTITVNTPAPATAANGTTFTVAATASSGLTVAYSATGSCSNVGGAFTITSGTGTCTVHYNQAGDADYNAATEITSAVASQPGSQTINVTTSAPASASNGTSFNVAATSSSGLAVVITTSGDCSGGGTDSATITITATPGACTVHYNQSGNADFSPAAEVTQNTSAVLDTDGPAVTVNQAAAQLDPVNTSPINFTVVFNEAVIGFNPDDITIGGTAGATTAVITGAGPTYNVAISGMANDGTVIISIAANRVTDASGNGNSASTSTDNIVTYLDGIGPSVALVNTIPETADHVLSSSEIVTFDITQFKVQFNQAVFDPAGDSAAEDVTNPNNYMLIRDLGDTAGLQTVSCVAGAVVPADTKIAIGTVTYDSQTYTATFTINGGLPLSNGDYHLFVCGTTSIVDPLNNGLALVGNSGLPGSDYRHTLTVSISGNGGGGGGGGGSSTSNGSTRSVLATTGALIPVTGFNPNEVTMLPAQPEDRAYSSMDDITIEIPSLGIEFPIVGVNVTDNGWNLTWLKDNVGYLEDSAYPTFNGNTVLTAHVRDANKHLGPFSDIKGLQLGDKILLHTYGNIYVYEVQENLKIKPNDISMAFKHEEYSWVTLITCEDYNAKIEEYYHRRMVRAVLISVVPER